ncbi:MAG: hypothetical protein EHM42_13710 [Planctomycetaceae bacterium]|nr:MAG: hypothetical protein EHM42_13710 [Planctomycetaceae bacterium]
MTAKTIHRTFAALACVVVGVAVVWGFALVGSPATERLRKLDERRIREMQAIRSAVRSLCVERSHGQTKLVAAIPETLTELDERVRRGDVVSLALQLNDPQTGTAYGYKRIGESQFEVCAVFALPRDKRREPFWNHAAGEACFRFDILEHSEGLPAPTTPVEPRESN